MPYVVQPMQIEDVEEVSRVERECFTTPWPTNAYRRELRENRLSRYVVLRWQYGEPSRARVETSPGASAGSLAGVRRAVSQLLRPFGIADSADDPRADGAILGFAGMWLMLDEAHITTIGVRQVLRGRGLGELLLVHLIEGAREMGAKRVTLEVRASNGVAQALYRKYTFREEGVRKRYYSDNGEDALIMWSDRIDEADFQRQFAELKLRLHERLAEAPPPSEIVTT